jgi:NTP pyrophosphatase (non-canonical NTP hydrolase)
MREDFLQYLRRINAQRWAEWSEGRGEDPLFQSNEFGGEAGEVLNVVKKLEREARGWKGSRDTVEHLAEEIADCVICLDSLARAYDIDIATAVVHKFNKTSDANGFDITMSMAAAIPEPAPVAPAYNAMALLDEYIQQTMGTPRLCDLEQEIMACWMVTDDIDTLYKEVMDHTDYGKLDSDYVANFLLGVKTIYDTKFNHLFSSYEALIAAQADRDIG